MRWVSFGIGALVGAAFVCLRNAALEVGHWEDYK